MIPLTELTDRKLVGKWLTKRGIAGEGVEIGCQIGENAERILNLWHGSKLHLVDSWAKWPDALYQDGTNAIDFDKAYQETKDRMAQFHDRAAIWKMSSQTAARMFKGQGKLFDFIYIDANHSYEFMTADLKAWWPLAREGALFGGHDYLTLYRDCWICEVEQAVNEFFSVGEQSDPDIFTNPNRRTVHVTQEEGGWPSWWVIK